MARYIDADALIQLGLQDGAYEYVSVQEIADFPTADVVEVVHGEWKPNNLNGFKIYDCSNCGIHMETKWNYCPHCGARMDGGR